MISFLITSLITMLIVLVILFRPYIWSKASKNKISRKELNTIIYREELAKIDLELSNGLLNQVDYEHSLNEIRQRLLQDLQAEYDPIWRSPRKTVLAVATLLPILTILLYLLIGSAFDVRDDGKHSSTQEIDKMVSGLASKLEKEPDNYKGWAMLARSYKVMKRPIESERAFERALPFVEKDPQLLADYADVVATNANGNFSGKPIDLINMALKLDPHHAMSLWLAGSAAFNAEQYQLAIQYWSRLYQLMPADSDDGRSILASINEAREKQNLPILSEIKVAPKNMTLEKSMKNSAITGMVEIDPKLKAKRSNADILMVIARGPDSRMPVAVLRIPSPLLPYKFTLDDSNSMSPEFKISNLKEVNLEVRISKLGQAKLESGDLIGEISFVKVNQKNIKVLIDKVQP